MTLRELDGGLGEFLEVMERLTDNAIDTLLGSISGRETIMEPDRGDLALTILRRQRDILEAKGAG